MMMRSDADDSRQIARRRQEELMIMNKQCGTFSRARSSLTCPPWLRAYYTTPLEARSDELDGCGRAAGA
jgi:hypothetical protein